MKSISQLKKKKKSYDQTVLPETDRFNTIEILISIPLINSDISHGDFFSVNNILRENDEKKKKS